MKKLLFVFIIVSFGCKMKQVEVPKPLLFSSYSANENFKFQSDTSRNALNSILSNYGTTVIAPLFIIPIIIHRNNSSVDTVWKGDAVSVGASQVVRFSVPKKFLRVDNNELINMCVSYVYVGNFIATPFVKKYSGNYTKTKIISGSDLNLKEFTDTVKSEPRKADIYYIDVLTWDSSDSVLKSIISSSKEMTIDLNSRNDAKEIIKFISENTVHNGHITNDKIPVVQTTYKVFVKQGNTLKYLA